MSGQRIFLEFLDVIITKAGKVVIGFVIFADVINSQIDVLAFAVAAQRSFVGSGLVAPVPLARNCICLT